uniref:SAG-related sequence SRS53D n=1 Tax=Toxoplasma gondii COUG TaxID=1074873 RepID=A0A2G8Y199_TOXGO|nr:SAG-related sequence SRS53D [Toxoplasma gondii COUG]
MRQKTVNVQLSWACRGHLAKNPLAPPITNPPCCLARHGSAPRSLSRPQPSRPLDKTTWTTTCVSNEMNDLPSTLEFLTRTNPMLHFSLADKKTCGLQPLKNSAGARLFCHFDTTESPSVQLNHYSERGSPQVRCNEYSFRIPAVGCPASLSPRKVVTMAGAQVIFSEVRMTGALFLVVVGLMSTAALGNNGQGDEASKYTCTTPGAQTGISVTVDTTTKKAMFICDAENRNVLPSTTTTKLTKFYNDKDMPEEMELDKVFGEGSEATIMTENGDSTSKTTVVLTLGELPEKSTTIYFGCTSTATSAGAVARLGRADRVSETPVTPNPLDGKCIVTVTVPADPAANTCTLTKGNMNLEISSTSKSVSFQCDTDIAVLNPETVPVMVYDESCKEEVKLSDKLPTAKLESTKPESGHTFRVEHLPENAQSFCYKCSASAPEQKNGVAQSQKDSCTVKINVAAASLESAASTSAAAGSVVALIFALALTSFFLLFSF